MLKTGFFAIFIIFISVENYLGQDSEQEMKIKCQFLNNVRANFTICCRYPTLVVWIEQIRACSKQCAIASRKTLQCCVNACSYHDRNILVYVTNEDGSTAEMPSIGAQGIIASFMLSVGNDSQWLPTVSNSVQTCYEYYLNQDSGSSQCNLIPMKLYDVIDCSYEQNFLNCPIWNPHGLKACEYSHEYVEKCMSNIEFKSV